MLLNNWTKALATLGIVSLASAASAADETVMSAVSGTTISGYVSTSASWAPGTGNALTTGKSFNDAVGRDGFNIDHVSLSISKPVDEGEWAAGYTTELWFGPDSAALGSAVAVGGDLAVKQASVDLRVPVGNGIDIKMGLFDTIIGYENAGAAGNPNWSRSLGWSIEPTQHTGVLASYSINDIVSVMGGIAESYNAVPNPAAGSAATRNGGPVADESEKTYMAAVSVTAPENFGALEGANLYLAVIDGLKQVGGGVANFDTTHVYAGLTVPTPVEGLSLGVAWDYRFNGITPPNGPANSPSWEMALAGYISYAATEKLTLNYRADYGKGSDGSFGFSRLSVLNTAVTGPAAAIPNVVDDEGTTKILANTLTLDYKLWENVTTRIEGRWDHSLSGSKQYGGQVAGGAQNGADGDRNAISAALNVIYHF